MAAIEIELGRDAAGIQYAFSPEIDLVLDDKVQIQQVVPNLVRNAVDALAECDSPLRQLLVKIEPAEGGMAQVTVADTGPGISPEIADQLFQPFITTKREGTRDVSVRCLSPIEPDFRQALLGKATGGETMDALGPPQ